ncbi:MAG: protein-L-isoaspartate(D-aspartate) O-methyltransferase [Rubrivivax sp.]|nr:protein-L-isoaspartate(D-aspartate) O-methyltransferase [Rubrivivax sp.]
MEEADKADNAAEAAGAGAAARRRAAMVEHQLVARGVRAPALLQAMREVPRERFVEAALADRAYDDSPLPIGQGQTISQPYIVAAMAEAADVRRGDTVLEVGAGSGYAVAVLARLAAHVCAIERHASLADEARARLAALQVGNADLRAGDGTLGWPEPGARFDVIVVSAAGPEVPPALKAQLAIGGRLVMPVGDDSGQQLVKLTRTGEHTFASERITPVRFVPLIGEQGWHVRGGGPAAK